MMSLGMFAANPQVQAPKAAKRVVELDSHRPVPIRFSQSDEVVLCRLAELSSTINKSQGPFICVHLLSRLPVRLFWWPPSALSQPRPGVPTAQARASSGRRLRRHRS